MLIRKTSSDGFGGFKGGLIERVLIEEAKTNCSEPKLKFDKEIEERKEGFESVVCQRK